jgi:hypothetical protein
VDRWTVLLRPAEALSNDWGCSTRDTAAQAVFSCGDMYHCMPDLELERQKPYQVLHVLALSRPSVDRDSLHSSSTTVCRQNRSVHCLPVGLWAVQTATGALSTRCSAVDSSLCDTLLGSLPC